jgi:hypothetical protein
LEIIEIDPDDPYAIIRTEENKIDSKIVCDICLNGDIQDDNEIVICEICLCGVHQACYGIPELP